ncbi:hypothetical protein GGX14DRAFT_388159 [Mycena pura]|uniref:Velvet domain-containing protein n=1 Tax=Mycena pura TaxID=153505 RepID=A0AAD6YKU0_9AGAR|nr:hypothetical protein GGX14DRAFT_388159 [Mycena pura]
MANVQRPAAMPSSDAGFFVLPDLSMRMEGSYRFKLSLFEDVGYTNVPAETMCGTARGKSILGASFYVYRKSPGRGGIVAADARWDQDPLRKDIRMRRGRHKMSAIGPPLGSAGVHARAPDSLVGVGAETGMRTQMPTVDLDPLEKNEVQQPPQPQPQPQPRYGEYGVSVGYRHVDLSADHHLIPKDLVDSVVYRPPRRPVSVVYGPVYRPPSPAHPRPASSGPSTSGANLSTNGGLAPSAKMGPRAGWRRITRWAPRLGGAGPPMAPSNAGMAPPSDPGMGMVGPPLPGPHQQYPCRPYTRPPPPPYYGYEQSQPQPQPHHDGHAHPSVPPPTGFGPIPPVPKPASQPPAWGEYATPAAHAARCREREGGRGRKRGCVGAGAAWTGWHAAQPERAQIDCGCGRRIATLRGLGTTRRRADTHRNEQYAGKKNSLGIGSIIRMRHIRDMHAGEPQCNCLKISKGQEKKGYQMTKKQENFARQSTG